MKSPLDNIRVSTSPLSNNIQLYRMGKRSTDNALESKDVTMEVMAAVIDHLMQRPEKQGVFTGVTAGRRVKYTISVVEEEVTDAGKEQDGVGPAAGDDPQAAGGAAAEDRPARIIPTY